MNQSDEVVLRNAVLWARSPLTRFNGDICIKDGRITHIYDEGADHVDSGTAVDIRGMHVIPGLMDAHRHFFLMALLSMQGDAALWSSGDDALSSIEEVCRSRRSSKAWVFFFNMDYRTWKVPKLPSIREIDAVAQGVPVLVADTTLHSGLVSTEALRRANIRPQCLWVPGDVDTNRDGSPRGTIWEEAFQRTLFVMYREMFSSLSQEQKRNIILDEAHRCLQKGLTHVHDPGIPVDIQMLLKDAQDHTPLKISWSVTGYDSLLTPPVLKDHEDALANNHAPKSVKFFLDGAYRAAASIPMAGIMKASLHAAADSLFQQSLWPLRLLLDQKVTFKGGEAVLPYLRFADTEDLINKARVFADRGYRFVTHSLGNLAVRQAAEVIRRLKPVGASVEHMLIMSEADLDDFASCGAVASIQPGFIPFYAHAIERQGMFPYLKTFPLRSLLNRGVSICISSDGPCAADDPLHNIRRAVDRKVPDGTVFDPSERLSQLEALAAGTSGAANSMGIGYQGLAEGAPATFCIVDGDPFQDTSRVVQTWIDGVRAS